MAQRISTVFRGQDFWVVNKPAGLDFHSEGDEAGEKQPGLAVLLQQQYELPELYPVHRLDKMTSGLVVFALNLSAAQRFQMLFEQRDVEKYYLAISTHKPKKKQGWVKGDMLPARRGSWKLATTQTNPAVTQFISQSGRPNERWFLLKPHTGKTHQLRVALKSLGAPIVGDRRYDAVEKAQHEDRGYLHAYALRFEYDDEDYEFVLKPEQGERFLSDAADACLSEWQVPWQFFKTKEKKDDR
jgi:tRNA pseudouridine32 synthase/23S rRNA pseudouridine746 synthase